MKIPLFLCWASLLIAQQPTPEEKNVFLDQIFARPGVEGGFLISTLESRPLSEAFDHFCADLETTVRAGSAGDGLWVHVRDWLARKTPDPGPVPFAFAGELYSPDKKQSPGLFTYRITVDGEEPEPKMLAHIWRPSYQVTDYCLGPLWVREIKWIQDDHTAHSIVEITNSASVRRTPSRRSEGEGLSSPPYYSCGRGARPRDVTFTAVDLLEADEDLPHALFSPNLQWPGDRSPSAAFRLMPGKKMLIRIGFGFGKDEADAARRIHRAIQSSPGEWERTLNQWFRDRCPAFDCPDEAMRRIYYYRWYLLKRNLVTGWYRYPALYEGNIGGHFPKVIGFPYPLQICEARWLRDRQTAFGQALNGIFHSDGTYFGYLNWAPYAYWQLYLVWPDQDLLRAALPGAQQHVQNYLAEDTDGDFLPTQTGSWPTGMEYQPAFFQWTDPPWDHTQSERYRGEGKQPTSIERVDKATYLYLSAIAVSRMAETVEDADTVAEYAGVAEKVRSAILSKMWDPETNFFYSLDPETDEKALLAKCIDGFFPFMFREMVGEEHLDLLRHLGNPATFQTRWPIPTVALDCPAFSPDNDWRIGPHASTENPVRYGCSWNGPSWGFTNSLVAECLGSGVRISRDRELKALFQELMRRITLLHFRNHNHNNPCILEHYHPFDGRPYNSIIDYFHSFHNDLIIRYLVGLVPRRDDLIEIDPLANEWDYFALDNVPYRGRFLTIVWDAPGGPPRYQDVDKGLSLFLDGRHAFTVPELRRVVYDPASGKVVEG
jgi:hypothetical protein